MSATGVSVPVAVGNPPVPAPNTVYDAAPRLDVVVDGSGDEIEAVAIGGVVVHSAGAVAADDDDVVGIQIIGGTDGGGIHQRRAEIGEVGVVVELIDEGLEAVVVLR